MSFLSNIFLSVVDTPPMPPVHSPKISQRDHDEKMAVRISDALRALCPSFERHEGDGTTEWHKCKCKVDNRVCTCVWLITDTCKVGTWDKLSFVQESIAKKEACQTSYFAESQHALIASNAEQTKQDAPIEDRFHILDIKQ